MKLKLLLTTLSICATLASANMDDDMGHGGGMGDGDHHGHGCGEHQMKMRILSVADYNGNGKVTHGDIQKVKTAVHKSEYHAIMDINTDGILDQIDIDLASNDKGLTSTEFDQQIVKVWKATRKYRFKENAIADGFRPFTQELKGHGQHFTRMPVFYETDSNDAVITSGAPFYFGVYDEDHLNVSDETVEITLPEGLNYDENGELVAVFYYQGINIADWVKSNRTEYLCSVGAIIDVDICNEATTTVGGLVMQSFSTVGLMINPQTGMLMDMGIPDYNAFSDSDSSEMWHQHLGACFDNFRYESMQVDPTHTPIFDQVLTLSECSAQLTTPFRGYLPAFNMMHLWLYKVNRCGIFAGTDPEVSQLAEEEPQAFDLTRLQFFGKFLSDL